MSDSLLVRYSPTQPALNTLVVSQYADKIVKVKLLPKKDQPYAEATFVPSGNSLKGDLVIARYIARAAPQLELYGNDPLTQTQIDQWIDVSKALKTDFDNSTKQIQTQLSSRKFLVHDKPTLADIAVWAEISLLNKAQDLPESLQTWIKSIEEIPQVKANLKNVPKSTVDKASELPKKAKVSMEMNLQNVEKGKVVTRFPPEPSGYLHVGHMKAALLNNYYARLNDGKLILRFDDTNPAKEKEEYVENLIADLKRIEIHPDAVTHTSDHFDVLLQYAERLIKDGKGYMDATPKENLRAERMDGIESVYRKNTIEENLKMWEEFRKVTELGKTYVLRGKIDMQSKNKALRDPIFYRVNQTPHHRTGTKYQVYPIYDFACPIVDSIEGVTHALRSVEYHDRQPLYYWVLDAFNLRRVQVEDFSRLSFKYTVLSKRYLQAFINKGLVSGWDDPAFPTIQGLLRRGLTVEGARQYILSQGASRNTVNIQIESMWAINKQVIDPIVPRYTAFPANQKVKFVLSNGPAQPEQRSVARHKKNASLGEKVLSYTKDVYLELEDAKGLVAAEEVTLMDWGNAIIREVVKNEAGDVSEVRGDLHLEGDFKTTKKKLTWLPIIDDLVEVTLVEYGNLITAEKLEKDEPIENFINPKLRTETIAIGDPNLRLLPKGQRIQLERRGYFIVDRAYLPPSSNLVLILIPDGRMVDVYKRG